VADLIPIKFQLIGVLIFLIGALTVFHLGFVRKKRTRRFWVKVDYAYYFIGVLGLAGITDNFQDLTYNLRLGLAERAFERRYQTLHQQVDTLDAALNGIDYQKWMKEGNYPYTSPSGGSTPIALPAEVIPHFRAATAWFSVLTTGLAGKERTERWRELLTQTENTGDTGITVLDTDKNGILEGFKHLLSLERTAAELRKQVTSDSASEHELVELFIAPYLIALALALRISKTSAEFFDRVLPFEE
jgi:hypothetical protein